MFFDTRPNQSSSQPLVLLLALPLLQSILPTWMRRANMEVQVQCPSVSLHHEPDAVVNDLTRQLNAEIDRIHIVVVDQRVYQNNARDGIALVRELRRRTDWNHVRIIVLGKMNMQDMVRAKVAGADDYVFHPLNQKTFLNCVQTHLWKEVKRRLS